MPDLTHSNLKNLPLLNGIIYEGLRLYSIVPGLTRCVPTGGFAVEHEGQKIVIPEGTWVNVATRPAHCDPNVWQRANEFWPERWIGDHDSDEKGGPSRVRKDAFFPFSEGSRSVTLPIMMYRLTHHMPLLRLNRDCLGKTFGWQEMRLVLANFVFTFDFELAPGCDPQPLEYFIVTPKDGRMDFIMRKRKV